MKHTILFTVILFLSACDQVEINTIDYRKYTVEAGKNDFTPNPFPAFSNATSWEGECELDKSCWFNNLGEDNWDWNKICGFYANEDFPKTNRKNNIMLAWRPNLKQPNTFEVTFYENINFGNFPFEDARVVVNANEKFKFSFLLQDGKYKLIINDTIIGVQKNSYLYTRTRPISAWFGGTSKAPHKMWLWYKMRKI